MFIGKRGLSYRGNKTESTFLLDDPLIDHGNFLELLLLLSKYDEIMKVHLDRSYVRVRRDTVRLVKVIKVVDLSSPLFPKLR